MNSYLDGALDPAQAFEVARVLALEPKKAARVASYRAGTLALQALYGHVAGQPVPDRLLVVFRRHAARTNRRRFFQALVAALVALGVLAAGSRAVQPLLPAPAPAGEPAEAPAQSGGGFVPI